MLVRVIPVRAGGLSHAVWLAVPHRQFEARRIRADVVLRPAAGHDIGIILWPQLVTWRRGAPLALPNRELQRVD